MEKFVLTEENKFHPEIAINIKKWLGSAPISQIKAAIKYDLIQGIVTLQEEQKSTVNLSTRAQIASIDKIEIIEIDFNHLQYTVEITTISGERRALTGFVMFDTEV